MGISAVAVIATSHISIHTPGTGHGYATVDIFFLPGGIYRGEICRLLLQESLKAEQAETKAD